MLIDMHMHEGTYSSDSFLELKRMVEIGKKKGLDGICITDHDSMGLKEYAKKYSEKVDFPIFVGIEYYSLEGDILAFGIEEYPKERKSAQEFIDCVKEQGGITIAAHPFRNNNRGLEENLLRVRGLDGIEVLNGSTSIEACRKARNYARYLEVQATGASDCHVEEKIGVYATYFPYDVKDVNEMVDVFKKEKVMPVYFREENYHLPFSPTMIECVYK